MIQYDFKDTFMLTKGDEHDFVWFLAYRSKVYVKGLEYLHRLPQGTYRKYARAPWDNKGDSFIVNPKELFLNEVGASLKEIYEYCILASCRHYFDYAVRQDSKLHSAISDLVDINPERNQLLTVKDDYINFKYETEKTEEN